jgi:hypothetical protein
MGWKPPIGNAALRPPEFLRRDPEGRDEFRVETEEIVANHGAGGMKAWGRRPLRALDLCRPVLPQDGLGPEGLFTALLPLSLGRGFD